MFKNRAKGDFYEKIFVAVADCNAFDPLPLVGVQRKQAHGDHT
jgi:hypothetical protein